MVKINFQSGKFIKVKKIGVYYSIGEVNCSLFDFLKFEHPKLDVLINKGVKYVVMSFDKNRKKDTS